MAIVFQAAGRLRPQGAEGMRDAFAGAEALLKAQPGFAKARLLVSRATLQTQILLYWESYEAGAAFQQGEYAQLAKRIAPFVEPRGTLIASMLECSIEPERA